MAKGICWFYSKWAPLVFDRARLHRHTRCPSAARRCDLTTPQVSVSPGRRAGQLTQVQLREPLHKETPFAPRNIPYKAIGRGWPRMVNAPRIIAAKFLSARSTGVMLNSISLSDNQCNRMPFCIIGPLLILCWPTLAASPGKVADSDSLTQQLPEVTVIAPRPPTEEELAGDSVSRFVATHGSPAVITGQLPRWRDGICPITEGLSPGFNAYVSARILSVAAAVGAPYKSDRCKHNVQILFTTEPQKLINELAKRNPEILGFHYPHETQTLATFSHPIQSWYMTATRGNSGSEVLDNPLPVRQGSSPLSNMSPDRWLESGTSPPGDAGSHLSTGLDSVIVHALIIVDTKKVVGYEIGTVSDYLGMLVLSHTRLPDDCSTLPSILDIMTPGCTSREKPTQTTAGDLAFLRALYAVDMRESLWLEGRDIRNYMMRQFKPQRQSAER
jgi:hypothetical protein